MNKHFVVGAVALWLASGGMAQAAGDAAKGAIKASYCYGCHQIPGWRNAYPAYHVPKLAGQHADYIVAALTAYKNGARDHGTMHSVAVSLSEQDMADLAAYYSAGAVPAPAAGTPPLENTGIAPKERAKNEKK